MRQDANSRNQIKDPLQPDKGNWSLSADGKLSCDRTQNASCISFPIKNLGYEYDLSFNVIRTAGKDSLAVYLPTSIGPVTFELDAWNKQLAGIQALDGRNLKQHSQTFNFKMLNGQHYHLLIKVRTTHTEVEIDGKIVYRCDLSEKKGSIINLWDLPRKHPLSIAAWSSAMTFSNLILKKIP